MAETALKFGPEWLRALSHGNNVSSPPTSPEIPMPKYKLADYRYGREEMLALFCKDTKLPESLKEFQYLIEEKCQIPLAFLPVTEEEQRIWSRSINSDVALRVSGKGGVATGNGLPRGGRGGSVDRGRGRGRGGYYQRGLSFEDGEDGPPGGFSRPRPIERSQSASEKDQRWDDRDRRFDRPFSGRTGGVLEENNGLAKPEGTRAPLDNWRKIEKDDESGWRTAGTRPVEKLAGRGSWRNHNDRERNHDDANKSKNPHTHDSVSNGPLKSASRHPNQRSASGHFWDDDMAGDNLPEWSMEGSNDTDIVGTFDATGAFLETKTIEDSINADDIYASDDGEECSPHKESPEAKTTVKSKIAIPQKPSVNKPVPNKATVVKNPQPAMKTEETPITSHVQNKSKPIDNNDKHIESEKLLDKMALPSIPEQNSIIQSEKAFATNSPLVGIPDLKKSLSLNMIVSGKDISVPTEEDAFAHHQKATENMVAQWTEEEEQQVMAHTVDKTTVLPPHHEDAQKWFYRDPQGEVQGPFTSNEMLEWFRSGYFTMNLMVRRGCDELFSQLGELIKTWGCIPFISGNSPAPLRVTPITKAALNTPITQTVVPNAAQPALSSAQQPKQDQLRLLQQQILAQQIAAQQQFLLRHAQMQQMLGQLKQQESFTNLTQQQQHQLLQQFCAQQQIPRSAVNSLADQSSSLEAMPPLTLPLLGLTVPPLLKNDLSMWGVTPNAGTWPIVSSAAAPPSGSIWDADPTATVIEASELEKQHKLMAAEEDEKRRKAEEQQRLEEEHKKREESKRKREELKRKQEEERLRKEMQKQEEERKKLEELQRLEEEKKKQEELKRLEEQRRREEELRLEELRKEEQRKMEEQKRQAELEEQRKKELLRKQEELKQLELLKKQEELRKQEEKRKQDELQKLLWEKEQERLQEVERLKEIYRQKECEAQKERERQNEMEQRELENNQRLLEQKLKAQGPVWGIQCAAKSNLELSLPDIQRLQEEKEREEKEKLKQHQLRQQSLQQVQPTKNGLSWGKRSNGCNTSVKSLAEIQQEEADRMAQQQKVQKPVTTISPTTSNLGVWGNSTSQLNRVTSTPSWNLDISSGGFWDDALNSTTARKPTPKTNDSAFPALSNLVQPANVTSNKSKHVRAKKDEDAVMRLFETHRKPTDEFTTWCTEALSSLPSSVDVPTFVAFLKDIESPYEVFDYVKSYLGEGKEAKDFGKQFLERRSKYRNQAKQSPAEENMWGPAPALTPSVSRTLIPASNDCDGTACTKGKTKKRKNRMQKLDSSMLGFTVQSNPDRINVGEIDHVEGM